MIYSAGGSGFAGANGSMMIEVVVSHICQARALRGDDLLLFIAPQPFFHILANSIAEDIGEGDPRAILATTILAFAFSSILTGQLPGLVDSAELMAHSNNSA